MRWNLVQVIPLVFLPLVEAAGTVQDLWVSPQYPDYTTTYTAGTTIKVSWDPDLVTQFAFFCEDCDVSNVDLWLTGTSYTRKLEAGVDVNKTTSYEWAINLDDSDIEASTEWTFRFLPADASWGTNDQEISSAKFNLDPRPSTSSSATPSPTPDPTSTTSASSTPAATETNSDDADPDEGNSSTLSTGAKAGVGVGVGAGGLIIIALAFLLWKHMRALKASKAAGPGTVGGYSNINHYPPPSDGYSQGNHIPQGQEGYFAPPMTKTAPLASSVTTGSVALTELPGSENAREMDAGADAQRPPVEMDASARR